MTRNQIVLEDLVELINEHGGIDSFSQAMSQLMDRAMAIERADVLGAEPYQRIDTRSGYANGFKPKTIHTRLGPVPLKVPQVRGDVSFYPSALTKGPQTERALRSISSQPEPWFPVSHRGGQGAPPPTRSPP